MSTAKFAKRPRRQPGGRAPSRPGERVAIYGMHAAAAALANPQRTITAAFASANAAERLAGAFASRGLTPGIETAEALARRAGPDAVHQGIVVEAVALEPLALGDIAADGIVVALDQVTDPRNVGAILRVAAAFAARGLVLTRRHRPPESGVLAKAASGGLEHVPIIEVANLARALGEARDAGYWIAGLDSDGEAPFSPGAPGVGERPLMIVLGSEGRGLRRLTREGCDAICRIDLPGPIRSLNVATAAAVALHAASAG